MSREIRAGAIGMRDRSAAPRRVPAAEVLWTALYVLALIAIPLAPAAAGSVSYGYDPLGRASTALYDNGVCVLYTYDASGNLTSEINFAAPQTPAPLWGTASWGSFTWTSRAQLATWGTGLWGCMTWTAR